MAADYVELFEGYKAEARNMVGAAEEVSKAFGGLSRASMQDGSLSRKVKELIALAIAVSEPCEGCILYHVSGAIRAGATREEVAETIGVCVQMGGGPGMVYGAKALEAFDQLNEAKAEKKA